ncbi:MSTO1 protein, partial [Rhinopomastus cyanomelas]|nr:MSTO1 protein [Rhinopomastus cyanomelas]
MRHLAESLSFAGRKVVAAWASLPFPALRGCPLPAALAAHRQDVPWQLLSSCPEQRVSTCFAQAVVLRGVGQEGRPAGEQPPSLRLGRESAEQTLLNYLRRMFPGAFSTAWVLEQPCSTRPPYPQFFSRLLSREGFLLDQPPAAAPAAVESVPVLAALQSSSVLRSLLSGLHRDLRALNTRRWGSFFAAGVEEEDFREALQELRSLAECYETGLEASGSEDEGDSD